MLTKDVGQIKLCKKCFVAKPTSEFYTQSYKGTSFFTSPCKKCVSVRERIYKKKNRAHVREIERKWKHANPDKVEVNRIRYCLKNPEQRKRTTIQSFKRRQLKYPWKSSYFNAKSRCSCKKHSSYEEYGGRGIKFILTMDEVVALWNRDKAFLLKKPSLDRKNSNGNYEFLNCRFIELSENSRLGSLSRWHSK